MSVASRDTNPSTGLPAFTKAVAQEDDNGFGLPGGLDHRKLATVQAGSYTDNLNRKGSGSHNYTVCHTGSAIGSNTATVSL